MIVVMIKLIIPLRNKVTIMMVVIIKLWWFRFTHPRALGAYSLNTVYGRYMGMLFTFPVGLSAVDFVSG
jgi:hypothetical protein